MSFSPSPNLLKKFSKSSKPSKWKKRRSFKKGLMSLSDNTTMTHVIAVKEGETNKKNPQTYSKFKLGNGTLLSTIVEKDPVNIMPSHNNKTIDNPVMSIDMKGKKARMSPDDRVLKGISGLPNEILEMIFCYLEMNSLLKAIQFVNKNFHEIIRVTRFNLKLPSVWINWGNLNKLLETYRGIRSVDVNVSITPTIDPQISDIDTIHKLHESFRDIKTILPANPKNYSMKNFKLNIRTQYDQLPLDLSALGLRFPKLKILDFSCPGGKGGIILELALVSLQKLQELKIGECDVDSFEELFNRIKNAPNVQNSLQLLKLHRIEPNRIDSKRLRRFRWPWLNKSETDSNELEGNETEKSFEIGQFSNLKTLEIVSDSYNPFPFFGSFWVDLCQKCVKLSVLNLTFTNPKPDVGGFELMDFTHISTTLTEMCISSYSAYGEPYANEKSPCINSESDLKGLENLVTLKLVGINIRTSFDFLKSVMRLRKLELINCDIPDTFEFPVYPTVNLSFYKLIRRPKFGGIGGLYAHRPSVNELKLMQNLETFIIQDKFRHLGTRKYSTLSTINTWRNRYFGFDVIESLYELKKLKKIEMRHTRLDNMYEFSCFPNLEILDLRTCDLTGIRGIEKCSKLKELYVTSIFNYLTTKDYFRCLNPLKNLEILHLIKCKLREDFFSCNLDLPKLKVLNLTSNFISLDNFEGELLSFRFLALEELYIGSQIDFVLSRYNEDGISTTLSNGTKFFKQLKSSKNFKVLNMSHTIFYSFKGLLLLKETLEKLNIHSSTFHVDEKTIKKGGKVLNPITKRLYYRTVLNYYKKSLKKFKRLYYLGLKNTELDQYRKDLPGGFKWELKKNTCCK